MIATKGTRKVRYRASGRKGQVTIVGCVGQVIPPMVIFDAQKLNTAWTEGEFPGTKYGLSSNGWINTELFESWLSEHFLEHAVTARPFLLLLDGHSTHYHLRIAKQHDVIMLCLPPHTTHESQPLDCGVFGPLKSHCVSHISAAKPRADHHSLSIQCSVLQGMVYGYYSFQHNCWFSNMWGLSL